MKKHREYYFQTELIIRFVILIPTTNITCEICKQLAIEYDKRHHLGIAMYLPLQLHLLKLKMYHLS